MKSLLLLSGGLDSAVALYLLRERGWRVSSLAINYGPPHLKEVDAARALDREVQVLVLPPMAMPGRDGEASVVPGRNGILLAHAVREAAMVGASHVHIGAHLGDAAIYPDCRPEFIAPFSQACIAAYGVAVEAPFLLMSRAVIVQRGADLGVPFHLTWSCYVGGEKHCGACGACKSRRQAFQAAAVTDPTEYE